MVWVFILIDMLLFPFGVISYPHQDDGTTQELPSR